MVRERLRHGLPGLFLLLLVILALAIPVLLFVSGVRFAEDREPGATIRLIGAALSMVLWILAIRGFFVVAPNEAQVLQLFGDYAGTARVRPARMPVDYSDPRRRRSHQPDHCFPSQQLGH